MNTFPCDTSREDLCDAADLALTHLAQEIPEGHQLFVVSTIRPALSELRNGSTDYAKVFALIDALPAAVTGDMLRPLRCAVIAMTVEQDL